ncbi:MAG: dihydroorotate dehydrogenase electron transfer subunit [Tidjanibacter sp.]|nr:dihydroorotate dehydrogenase electron transfer subunit [Tidjanibacter sp.]
MYKQGIYKIVSNSRIAKSVYKMVLEGDTQYVTAPGQFVNIELEGKFLRRPISVCDYDERTITIIYKVVGAGTEQMSHMAEGEELDVLTGLGNGFDTSKAGERNLLVGGGVGVPPMYNLAKTLKAAGRQVSVVMGFNAEDEIFYAEEFKALGVDMYVATADGSVGTKGFVTDVIREKALQYDYFFTCGPLPMLKALYDATGEIGGQLSFEERMGCGFGACMGCSCQTKYGTKRICKDGPVLLKEEVIW